jgi:hypothetical protein
MSLLSDLTATPIAWAPVYEREWRPAIATDGTLVFAVSATSFYSTTLPIGSAAWKEAMVLGYLGILNDIAYASGTFVAVGQKPGDSVSPATPLIATRTATTGWAAAPL